MQYNTENMFPPFFLEKAYMLQVLSHSFGGVYIHVDQRVKGVEIPPEREDDDFFIDVEQGNILIDNEEGVQILIFSEGEDSDREPFTCKIPWQAVYAFRYGPEFMAIWIEDTPQPVLNFFIEEKLIPEEFIDPDYDTHVWISGRMQWGMQFAVASMEVWLGDEWQSDGKPKKVLMESIDDPPEDTKDITSRFSVLAGGKESDEVTIPPGYTVEAREVGVGEVGIGAGQLRVVGEEGEEDVSKDEDSAGSGTHIPGDAV